MEPSVEEIFAAMSEAVRANPALKSKFNACVELRIKGESKPLTLDVSKTPKNKPDLIVTLSLDTCHKIFNKKMTPQQAFMKGALKIKGNMGLAMKLTLIMNATRQQLRKKQSKL